MTHSNDGTKMGAVRFRLNQLIERADDALENDSISQETHTEVISILENIEGYIDYLEENNIGD